MAKEFTIEKAVASESTLGNAGGNDVTVRVTDTTSPGTVGRLRISRGGIDWFEGKASKTYKRTSWDALLAVLADGKAGT